MIVNFKVGFSEVESIDLTDIQVDDLLHYFLSRDIHFNQAILSVIKSGNKINEENVENAVWYGLIQK